MEEQSHAPYTPVAVILHILVLLLLLLQLLILLFLLLFFRVFHRISGGLFLGAPLKKVEYGEVECILDN
jgi:hypothetical protein